MPVISKFWRGFLYRPHIRTKRQPSLMRALFSATSRQSVALRTRLFHARLSPGDRGCVKTNDQNVLSIEIEHVGKPLSGRMPFKNTSVLSLLSG